MASIELALTTPDVNVTDGDGWDTVNFNLFNGVWTLFIGVPYFILTPIFIPALAHRWALVAVDAVTMIFWFAGFIALAVDLGDVSEFCSDWSPCQGLQAAAAFGAFNWYAVPEIRMDP